MEPSARARYADRDRLTPYMGGLHTEEEIAEFRLYGDKVLPLGSLPRAVPQGLEAPAPLRYRSRVYGPHDHLPAAPERPSEPVYTFRYAMHRGQTKLCAIEVEAITRALGRYPGLKYVLYAGAAPGEHIVFLAEAFPTLEFHLVDPAEFRVFRHSGQFPDACARIHVTRALFTDETAEAWRSAASETIFFSDVRSGDHSQDEFEREVWENMQMQLGWWERARFAATLFKFRLPYTSGETRAGCAYPEGDILLQPFGPLTSTEGRLFVWADAAIREYDPVKYEDFYFWLNTVVREWASFDHGIDLRRVPGLCRCFDCARTVQILREYAESQRSPDPAGTAEHVVRLIGRMVEATGQTLDSPPHGLHAEALPADKRLAMAAAYGRAYERRRKDKIRARAAAIQYAPPVVQPHLRPPSGAGAPASRSEAPPAAKPRGGAPAAKPRSGVPPAANPRSGALPAAKKSLPSGVRPIQVELAPPKSFVTRPAERRP